MYIKRFHKSNYIIIKDQALKVALGINVLWPELLNTEPSEHQLASSFFVIKRKEKRKELKVMNSFTKPVISASAGIGRGTVTKPWFLIAKDKYLRSELFKDNR